MTALAVSTSTTGARSRPRARWWVVLVAVLVGALAAGSGAVVVVRDDRRLADVEALGTANVRVTAAIADLAGPISAARTALHQSAGRVNDEQARTELAAALESARAAVDATATHQVDLDAVAAQLVSSRSDLITATDAVSRAVAAWDLAQAQAAWSEARTRLDATVSAAQAILDSSAGRVADDGVRQALASALNSARILMDAAKPSIAAALSTSATAMAAAADALGPAQTSVAAAVDSWEQAQAAAADAASATATGTQHHAPPRKPSVMAAGLPATHPSTDPYDGLTWVPNTDGSYTLCTDAAGTSWWCNATPVPGVASDGSQWVATTTDDGSYTVCMDTNGNWWWCDA
jgi:hypothetical protein